MFEGFSYGLEKFGVRVWGHAQADRKPILDPLYHLLSILDIVAVALVR